MSKDFLTGAGHGGSDTGAIAVDGSYEKHYALELSKLVYDKVLTRIKNKTYILRKTDKYISLGDRCKYANSISPIYWFEFHFNAYNKEANGIEIFTSYFTSQTNKDLAAYMCKEIAKLTGVSNRGAKTKRLSSGKDYYYLHRNTNSNVTCFIIEPGFLDNKKDFAIITKSDYMEKVSDFFAKCICENIYNVKYENKPNYIYRVQTGAFTKKENAVDMVNALKKKGFDAIIKAEKQ